MSEGYRIPFHTLPPLTRVPKPFKMPISPTTRKAICAEIATLQRKQVICRVPKSDLNKPAFYSSLFLVPKPDGTYRPIFNIKRLNTYITCPHFKMETVMRVRHMIQPGDQVITLDLSDAYLHVPINPASFRFLRFAMSPKKVYYFRALPFGLCTAPLVFTRIVEAIAALIRTWGVHIHVYLDDWLVRSQSRNQLLQIVPRILELLKSLGWIVNLKKSRLTPSQTFEYLGLSFDTRKATVRPADHLVLKASEKVTRLRSSLTTSPREIQSALGLFNFMADYARLGRLKLRPIQHWLHSRFSPVSGDLDVPLTMTSDLREFLLPWADARWLTTGLPLVTPEPTVTLFTDASLQGWGAVLGQREARGFWDRNQTTLHINELQMLAVKLAVSFFQQDLTNQTLLLLCDNATAVAYLRKEGGTRSLRLCLLATDILRMCSVMCTTLVVRHIPSKRNVLADALSRTKPLTTEWQLNKAVFSQILELAPNLELDLFATRINTQLDLLCLHFRIH